MMGEYVKRSDALHAVGDIHPLDYNGQGIVKRIKDIPAADVVEVRHGRWIWELANNGWANHICSECGYAKNTDIHVRLGYDYCPRCGAKMDGGQD